MKKEMLKGASSVFLCWTGLIAVVCVPSFIAGLTCTKPGKPVPLLNATVTRAENDVLSLSDAVNPADHKMQPADTVFGTQAQPAQSSDNRIEAKLCNN